MLPLNCEDRGKIILGESSLPYYNFLDAITASRYYLTCLLFVTNWMKAEPQPIWHLVGIQYKYVVNECCWKQSSQGIFKPIEQQVLPEVVISTLHIYEGY